MLKYLRRIANSNKEVYTFEFLRDNKREFIILTIYILFVPFPLGMIPLLFLSELAQTNWVESDF